MVTVHDTSELSLGSFTGRCTCSLDSSATHALRSNFLTSAHRIKPRHGMSTVTEIEAHPRAGGLQPAVAQMVSRLATMLGVPVLQCTACQYAAHAAAWRRQPQGGAEHGARLGHVAARCVWCWAARHAAAAVSPELLLAHA